MGLIMGLGSQAPHERRLFSVHLPSSLRLLVDPHVACRSRVASV